MKKSQDRFIYFGEDDFLDEDDWMGDGAIAILENETDASNVCLACRRCENDKIRLISYNWKL